VLHWEEETPIALKAWRQTSTTGKTTQGEQNPGPNGQGKQKPKNKAGRRRREASPPVDKIHPNHSLSRKLSDFLSLVVLPS